MRFLAVAVTLLAAVLAQEQTKQQQPRTKEPNWGPIAALLGNWSGQSHGQPGKGEVSRSYHVGVGGTFIVADNCSVWAPRPTVNPTGEVHVDHGLVSFDKARKKYVLRQFHVEGFVNQYTLNEITPDGKKLVWVTETIENIPSGWRAKETYLLNSEDEFTEVFELAEPGKDFELYSQTDFHRSKKAVTLAKCPKLP